MGKQVVKKEVEEQVKDVKELKFTPEELKELQLKREIRERREKCAKEINEVLQKYNANLAIAPNSPISNPAIVINLN